jgi:mRNA-degrading endonuclease RelE of RelBE toxin-antitoxin system
MDYSGDRNYRVVFIKKALQDIRGLDKSSYVQVRDVVNGLAYNPRPADATKTGNRFQLKVPAGNYDIYYEIDPDAFFVIITKLVHH